MTDTKKDLEDALSFAQRGDYRTARRLLEPVAEQGNPEAQRYLGWIYEHGIGLLAKDHAEAVNWYRRAAEQGYAPAQASLGRMYEYGYGVEKDYAEAMKWFRMAADQGNKDGRGSIGRMYMYGEGVPKDALEAIKWWRPDADKGYSGSPYSIAHVYQCGHGVEKDLIQAYFWYILSMKSAFPNLDRLSKAELKKVVMEMTPEQLAEAKRLIAEWEKTHPAPAASEKK